MQRCDSAGTYEVTFEHLNEDEDGVLYGVDNNYNADIGPHGDLIQVNEMGPGYPDVVLEKGPRVSVNTPYVGELCEHELDWLASVPGTEYDTHRRYTVKKI